ncbi:hypothetical protein GCM10023205_44030 [Yinghuangia aomiensis]|uniref:Phasin protein n=1 Tax=Yinghuangia aomiensis TaxID=676205 RepID=A0ABP9HKJ5_9ACTN
MAGDFTVDFAWLDRLTAAFDGAARATDAALDALHETGPIRTGHKDLDKACDHFKGKWDDRVGDFQDRIGEFGKAVADSKTAYAATEQALTTSLSRITPTATDSPIRSALDPAGSGSPPSGTPLATPADGSIREVLG